MTEETIFAEAIAKTSPEDRAAYLAAACADDRALREQIDALIASHENAGSFLANPAAEHLHTLDASALRQELRRTVVPLAETTGTLIGRYKLVQQIGEGGFGTVFLAEQEHPVRRKVALKIIKLGMDTKQVIARFEAERQALAIMDHPNIAKVFDAGATETGRLYFVMELVRGVPITDYCDSNNLTLDDRLDLFVQVCHAIQHAHQKGIIHRDLKPTNVMIAMQDGKPIPKIIDFGIAKATDQRLTDKTIFTEFRQMVGTPQYMSPEQAEMAGIDIDTRSDIFSLGVLLYELLVGSTPFDPVELRSKAYDEMQRMIREVEPPRPSTRLSTLGEGLRSIAAHRRIEPGKLGQLLKGELDWIVMHAMEKDRMRRYETADSLAADVRRFLSGEAVHAAPPSRIYLMQKFVRRHKGPVAAAGFVAMALLLGVLGTTAGLVNAEHQRTLAESRLREATVARTAEATQREKAEENGRAATQSALVAQAKEAEARAQAVKSQQVSTFLKEMLKNAAPKVALGRDTTLLREILDRTAARIGNALRNQPEAQAELLQTLGETYADLDDVIKSEQMLREALRLRRLVFKGDHPDLADSLEREANALRRLSYGGDSTPRPVDLLHEGETLSRQAVGMRERLASPNPILARPINVLAGILFAEGKYAEAEQNYRIILAMQLDPAKSPIGYDGLATSLAAQGKFPEALAMHVKDLELRRKVDGEGSPHLISPLNQYGFTLQKSGDLKGAEAAWRESLALSQRYYPANHSDFWSTTHLIHLYRSQGRNAEADALAKKSQEVPQATTLPVEVSKLADSGEDFANPGPPSAATRKSKTPSTTPNPFAVSSPADALARKGDFRNAAVEFAKQLTDKPADSLVIAKLGALLAEDGDAENYRKQCHELLGRYAQSTDAATLRRLCKACLLAPLPEADTHAAAALTDMALARTTEARVLAQAQFAKGLAEYRLGHYPVAIQWMEKVIVNPTVVLPTSAGEIDVQAYAMSAAAHHKLHQSDKALLAMSKATEGLRGKWLSSEASDLGDHWQDLVAAHVLVREAQAVMQEP